VLAKATISSKTWRTAAVALTILWATFVAQPQDRRPLGQFESISASSTIDRSRKDDRLAPVAPAVKARTLVGCEPPFSLLARMSSSNFSRRCLT